MSVNPAEFSYRQKITGGSPGNYSGSFSFPINESCVHIDFFDHVADGGGDIRLCSDETGINELPVHREICNTTTKKLNLWAKHGAYSISANEAWIFCGNPSATEPAASALNGQYAVHDDAELVALLDDSPNTDAGGYADATGRYAGTATLLPSASVDATPWGTDSLRLTGLTNNGVGFSHNATSGGIVAYSIWAKNASLASDNGYFTCNDGLGDNVSHVWTDAGGSPGVEAYTREGSTTQKVGSDDDSDATLGWQRITLGIDENNDIKYLYLDGTLKATDAANANNVVNAQTYAWIGGDIEFNSRWFSGSLADFSLRRALTDSEHESLTHAAESNPGNFWTQSQPVIDSGGTTSLAANNLAVAAVMDQAALSPAHSLIASNLAASVIFNSVVLTQATTLVVPDQVVENYFSSAALTQQHTLVPLSLYSNCFVSAVPLGVSGLLVASSLQLLCELEIAQITRQAVLRPLSLRANSVFDSVALSASRHLLARSLSTQPVIESVQVFSGFLISVNSLVSQVEIEQVPIIQAHLLNAQRLASETALEAAVVSSAVILQPLSLTSGSQFETGTLSFNALLNARSLFCSAVADQPSLSQAHVLIVPDLASATIMDAIAGEVIFLDNLVLIQGINHIVVM